MRSINASVTVERAALVRRGLLLNFATIAYNILESIVSLMAGIAAGSVALIGFGLDSLVEVTASIAAQWRLRTDHLLAKRARSERLSLRVIGVSFIVLATYVGIESTLTLYEREAPLPSRVGVLILSMSVIVMPLLAFQKRRVAAGLQSRALEAESKQTSLCAYLSVIALAGVGMNYFFGLWWADALAALLMVPIIAIEGINGVRGQEACSDDCS